MNKAVKSNLPSTPVDAQPAADGPLFSSAHAALTFAYNHSDQVYDKPMMARLASRPGASGKGLGGVDGAGQAGIIQGAIDDLPPLLRAILYARFARRECACKSCGTKVDSLQWQEAIGVIATAAASQALSGRTSPRVLRHAIVERYFGKKVLLAAAADRADVSAATATNHSTIVIAWLRGTRTTKAKDGTRGDGEIGQEQLAMDAITRALSGTGLFD
jgi:hypothetical protein